MCSLKVAEENRALMPQELKPFLMSDRHLGSKPQSATGKAVAEFLSGIDVFVKLPTGYGEPLIYHMSPLISGD